MPRVARRAPGGYVFHVLNRGNDRRALFDDAGDYDAFERVMADTLALAPMRLLAYCLMPNHWHLLLWPREDGHLAAFMQRLTVTHVRRWHEHRHSTGRGHLYQGTYKSFPVQDDSHFLTVARYVERNALRAKLAGRAQDWRWGSLHARQSGGPDRRGMLGEWPVDRPADWPERVNLPQTDKEVAELQTSLRRGRPFGGKDWQQRTAEVLGLQATFNPPGRPKKEPRDN